MSVLVFTIALNGYGAVYARCLDSHRAYSKRNGYDYFAIDHPRRLFAPDVSSWLKIPLMQHALECGYQWVLFVDADCQIQPAAPPIETIEQAGKTLYMSSGHSGRVNAGVILAKNAAQTSEFLSIVLHHAAKTVPPEDRALYENGHVIHYSKDQPWLHVMDSKWNNNCDPDLDDYIRHFSAGGPMRKLYRKTPLGFAAHVFNRMQTKAWRQFRPGGTPPHQLRQRIEELTLLCLASGFPRLFRATEAGLAVPPEEGWIVHE